ncbi:DUF6777 domain-containing protein [Actinoplanes flavus]|uniref:DUF6777 domain-containing protein n=1 Tax=Actinoplanes flavus TaxID=2820290 RepID=A0ABS3UTG4_9ACTN|nr:DUF6777 domain-containing protein [Actinoplanes flavus]MBO3741883.1 hypothetical protein [Actinoplanes flavus]
MRSLPGIRYQAAAVAALMVCIATVSGGCAQRVAVQALARGVPAAAAFFDLGLDADADVGAVTALMGGTRNGDQPGLYGGSRNRKRCAKKKLAQFLEDPANRKKARAWADVQGIEVDRIDDFVEDLTPVLLRNDTLVKNYDYRNGRADGFDALLEAGIAVLVDRFGRPVVKCNCGNPLGTFEHDPDDITVSFTGRNKKWKTHRPEKVVKVEPAAGRRAVSAYELVDVDNADAGLERRAGTDGDQDSPLPDDPGGEDAAGPAPTVTDMPTESPDPVEETSGPPVETSAVEPTTTTEPTGEPAGGSPAPTS